MIDDKWLEKRDQAATAYCRTSGWDKLSTWIDGADWGRARATALQEIDELKTQVLELNKVIAAAQESVLNPAIVYTPTPL
jgi:hypothetical protein